MKLRICVFNLFPMPTSDKDFSFGPTYPIGILYDSQRKSNRELDLEEDEDFEVVCDGRWASLRLLNFSWNGWLEMHEKEIFTKGVVSLSPSSSGQRSFSTHN